MKIHLIMALLLWPRSAGTLDSLDLGLESFFRSAWILNSLSLYFIVRQRWPHEAVFLQFHWLKPGLVRHLRLFWFCFDKLWVHLSQIPCHNWASVMMTDVNCALNQWWIVMTIFSLAAAFPNCPFYVNFFICIHYERFVWGNCPCVHSYAEGSACVAGCCRVMPYARRIYAWVVPTCRRSERNGLDGVGGTSHGKSPRGALAIWSIMMNRPIIPACPHVINTHQRVTNRLVLMAKLIVFPILHHSVFGISLGIIVELLGVDSIMVDGFLKIILIVLLL